MKRHIWASRVLATAAVALGLSCRMQDVRTVIVHVPELKNEECARRIDAALRATEGVFSDKLKFEPQKVTVTYDSMKVAIKNIEFVIALAGFTANDIPADPAARAALPPECLEP